MAKTFPKFIQQILGSFPRPDMGALSQPAAGEAILPATSWVPPSTPPVLMHPDEDFGASYRGEAPQPAGVGDINSTAPGSAARYNAGKTPFELVPLGLIAEHKFYDHDRLSTGDLDDATAARFALFALGSWQATGERHCLMEVLSLLGDRWADCARVFDFGRRKYAEWNWAKGFQWSVPVGCAARHLLHVIEGETLDRDSGEHHFGHVYCNIVMLLTFEHTYPEGDDRPRLLDPSRLIAGADVAGDDPQVLLFLRGL